VTLYVQRASSETWSVTDAEDRVLHTAGRRGKALAWARRRTSNVVVVSVAEIQEVSHVA
jgi:hypothetical protein